MNTDLRERAVRLLARRDHSRSELARKLAGNGEASIQLADTLDTLSAQGLLSDSRYALSRSQSRSKTLGNARLAGELRAKGVDDELVNAALASIEDELSRAQRVWQRKYGVLPASAEEYARQARFLAARGFAAETIRQLLRGLQEND
ncbi:MAG TPA: regulatory protein RecX [Accumulibacter sp.]|nr:regulatory protein RecX [Accumulibacter sp.]HPP48054.1 regulatory protein RecX [Accumulibacter sp.]